MLVSPTTTNRHQFPSRWTLPLKDRKHIFLETLGQPKQLFSPSTGSSSEQVGFFGDVAVKTIDLATAMFASRHDSHNARLANHLVNIQRYHTQVLVQPSPLNGVKEMETYHVAKTLSEHDFQRLSNRLFIIQDELLQANQGVKRFFNKKQRKPLEKKQAQLVKHLSLQESMRHWAKPDSSTSRVGLDVNQPVWNRPSPDHGKLLLFQKNLARIAGANEITSDTQTPEMVNDVTRYVQNVGRTFGVWRVDVAAPVNGNIRLNNVLQSQEGLHLLDPAFENIWRYAGNPEASLLKTPELLKQVAKRAIRFR
jgi:hypothetical protein